METTPSKPKTSFSFKHKRPASTESTSDNPQERQSTSTPVHRNIAQDDEESPMMACTQELNGIDVIWDFNSPQDKRRFKKKKKLNLNESPKVPFKRYPSKTQMETIEKFREELKALRDELAIPEHEESLVLSPMEETKIKSEENVIDDPTEHHPPLDFFDDSLDDQLVQFSQQIENEMSEKEKNKKDTPQNNAKFKFKKIDDNKMLKLSNNIKEEVNNESNLLDDSMNIVFSQINDELTQKIKLEPTTNNTQINTHCSSSKMEFCRTESFELASRQNEVILTKSKLEEIERKRLEAMARLEQKRNNKFCSPSPTKCSPEEIEKKRLLALAKLEAKKQSDIIEKNRQEAILRLQTKRMKNASIVKSTLAKRL